MVAVVSGPEHDLNLWRRLEVELAPATYSSAFRLLVDTDIYNIYSSGHAVDIDTCLGRWRPRWRRGTTGTSPSMTLHSAPDACKFWSLDLDSDLNTYLSCIQS